jgi:hypothetical protein
MKAVSASALPHDGKPAVTDKAVKVLASAIFRQLQDEGCEPRHIISVSTQLLDLVTSALQQDSQ